MGIVKSFEEMDAEQQFAWKAGYAAGVASLEARLSAAEEVVEAADKLRRRRWYESPEDVDVLWEELAEALATASGEGRDYYYLCCNCGEISAFAEWTLFHHDPETHELVPAREGESDPLCRCPRCGWDHDDDDSNPGIYDGTRAEVEADRARLLATDPDPWAASGERAERELPGPENPVGGNCWKCGAESGETNPSRDSELCERHRAAFGEGEDGPTYDELVTGPGPEMTPEIRERLEDIAKQPRKELPAKPLPIREGAEPPGVVLSESLADDDAVMAGYLAVHRMRLMRVGSQHDHAEAFRRALLDRKGER